MRKNFTVILLVFTLTGIGCSKKEEIKHFSVATDDFIMSEFTDLIDSIFFFPIKRSKNTLWGEIKTIKMYEKFTVLHDKDQSQSLIFIEPNGTIRQFYKIGDGPSEYQQLSSFSIMDSVSFVIYDRNFGFKFYSYPEFGHLNSVDFRPDYLMTMESFDTDRFFLVKEHNYGELESGGYYFAEPTLETLTKTEIPNDYISIESNYPSTLNSVDSILEFIHPNVKNTFYTISADAIKKKFTFDFGAHNIDKEALWQSPDTYPFESEVYYHKKAAIPHFLIDKPHHFLFWFKNGLDQGLDNLAIVDKNENTNVVLKKISHEGENIIQDILPKGMKDDFYLTMLTDESQVDRSIASHYNLKLDSATEYIMGYRIRTSISDK